MKNIFLVLLLSTSLFSCKSFDYPSIEESQKIIDKFSSEVSKSDSILRSKKIPFPSGNDFTMKFVLNSLNKVLEPISYKRDNDINISFYSSPYVLKEEKSILGISYTNYLNVDGGFVTTNLKKFRFEKFENNKINAIIEIEGKGMIGVSGKYLGIPASVSPEIELYEYEPIEFEIAPTDNGFLLLKPIPKQLILKAKFFVNILGWKAPWYQEIPLQISDIMKPFYIPLTLNQEIQFPLPAKSFGDQKIEFAPYFLQLNRTTVSSLNDKLEFRTDINFKKK